MHNNLFVLLKRSLDLHNTSDNTIYYMIATLIKQALRCFKYTFKVGNPTQSSHNALRGLEIGLRY